MSEYEYILDNCSNKDLLDALIKIAECELQLTVEEEQYLINLSKRLV